MNQQSAPGKGLGGRRMALPPEGPRETEADRLRLGRDLFTDIAGFMERGEQVPDELAAAMDDFQAQAGLMLMSPHAATRDTYAAMLQRIEDGFAARAREDQTRQLMAGITGQDKSGATFYGYQPFELPEIPGELEGRAFDFGPENVRRLAISTAPLERDEDGRSFVTDQDGLRWELTEAMATLNQPTVREHLRQSLMGQIPGQAAVSATAGAMSIPQHAIGVAGALGLSENRRNVETAIGGLRLPWLVGFNPDGSMRGDEEEKLKDPLWARALQETLSTIDAKPTGWETFGHALALGIDFAGFSKLLGAIGRMGGLALGARGAPPVAKIVANLTRAGAKALPEAALPFNSVAKTALEFGLYESFAQSTNPDTTIPESFASGVGTGVVFGAAGRFSKFLRHQTVGRLSRKLWPVATQADELAAAVRRIKDPVLSKELANLEMSKRARDAFDHSIEAYLTGVMVHAYGEAQQAPEGEGFKTFWSKLFDVNSQATGLGFMLNSALMYGAVARPEIMRQMESPATKEMFRRVAAEFANPRAGQNVREAYEAFESMRARDPELFRDLTFRTPAKQEAVKTREAEALRRAEERPVDSAPAFEEMRKDEPLGLTMGEFPPAKLRMLGFRGKTNEATYKHALRAVNEYLRTIEGAEGDPYYRFGDVPTELMRRVAEWRDLGKPSKAELVAIERMKALEGDAPTPGTDPATVARLRGARQGELMEQPGAAGERAQGVRPTALPDTAAPGSPSKVEGWLDRALARSQREAAAEYVADELIERQELDPSFTPVRLVEPFFARGGAYESLDPKAREAFAKRVARVVGTKVGDVEWVQELPDGSRKERRYESVEEIVRGFLGDAGTFAELKATERSLFGLALEIVEAQRQHEAGVNPHTRRAAPARELPPAPGSLGEASRIYQQARGEPKNAGLAPLEVVEKAKKTPRRPSLGRALELVAAGKKDAAWLKETFPEGARSVGQGKLETWAGEFERAVRAEWKKRGERQARANLAKIAARRTPGIMEWIRSVGGVRYEKEMAGELRWLQEDSGKRGLLRGKETGKGVKLDDLAEMSVEAGFFAERPTINELLDAMRVNRERLDVAGQSAIREAEAERLEIAEGQLHRHRDMIESGEVPLPSKEELFGIFAGDPRYTGFTPERLEREMVQLRRQAEAGDPGARMAGPPEGPRETAYRAEIASSRAIEVLQAAGVVDVRAPFASRDALDGLDMALRQREAPEGVDPALWREARVHAAQARELTREVMRSVANEQRRAQLEDLWTYLDAREAGEPVSPELASRMAKRNWLDEFGGIRTQVIDRIQQITAESMETATRLPDAGFSGGLGDFFAPLAFARRKFADVTENLWGSKIAWSYWLDKPEVQRALGSKWGRKVFDAFTVIAGRNLAAPIVNLGIVSRPQSSAMRTRGEEFLFEASLLRGRQEDQLLAARMASALFHGPWRGLRVPQSHHDFLMQGMERGDFVHAKGPADFERMRPGTGYLFEVYTRTRDLFEELGREQVALGRMEQAQLDALGGGKYILHEYIRDEVRGTQTEIEAGGHPIRYVGRSMRRDGRPSPDEPAMRITDFGYLVDRAVLQESQSVRVWSMLRKYMDPSFEWALSRGQVERLGAFDRGDFQVAAVKPAPLEGESMESAVARMAESGQHPKEALLLGARLTLDREQMAKKGEEPRQGQRPYTKAMDELYQFWLGESPRGPVYIPRSHAQELEIAMSDVFAPPQGASATVQFIDRAFAFKKRGLTALRPQGFGLMLLGNATRNHTLGGPSIFDFTRGMLGLPSWTHDALRGGSSYFKWVGEGSPKEKPPAWTDAEWADTALAREFLSFAGSSASLSQAMGTEFAARLGASMIDPGATRAAWESQLQEAPRGRPWTTEQTDRMRAAIARKTDALFSGLESWDAKLSEQLGSHDPAEQARAIASFHTLWNLVDLFIGKYPTFLKLRHENPDVPISKLAHQALQKTGHAGDTDPWLRRNASMHGPWADTLWRAAQGKTLGVSTAKAKLFLSQFIRDRFWLDRASVFPQLVRAAAANLLAMAASYGAMALVARGIWNMMSDEEKERWTEEAKTARRALTRWGKLDPKFVEALERTNGRVGTIGGVTLQVPEWARDVVHDWWGQLDLKDPGTIPLPKKGGEGQIGSIGQLFPAGELLQTVQGAAKLWPGGIDSQEKAQDFLTGVEQLFGMRAQLAAELSLGVIGPDGLIVDGLASGGASEKFAKAMFLLAGSGGLLYPTLGLFSPEGVFMGEAVANGGRPWTDHFRGLVPMYQPDRQETRLSTGLAPFRAPVTGENMAGAGLRLLWPSRALYQRRPLEEPLDAYTSILQEMYGSGFDVRTPKGLSKLAAHTWTTRQFGILLGDLYEQHFDEATDPAKAHIDLDDRVWGATRETLEATEIDPVTELGRIVPGHEPKSMLLQAIARLPEDQRGHTIAHFHRWIGGQKFQQDGYAMLYEAGRKLEMSKGLFREGMLNALSDPSGAGLVKWWWSKVENGDEDTLRELAPLVWDVGIPGGGDALVAYRKLFLRYTQANYEWPPVPDSVQGPEVPGAPGNARALQGKAAFGRVLRQRPESALDELLLNPK